MNRSKPSNVEARWSNASTTANIVDDGLLIELGSFYAEETRNGAFQRMVHRRRAGTLHRPRPAAAVTLAAG